MGFKARTHDLLMAHRRRAPARIALEALSSAVASTRAGQRCRMRLDGPRWIHSYRDGSIVTPISQRDIRPPAEISAQMRDEFCYARVPQAGEVVIDVGAGIGEALLLFSSLVGPRGRVIAVEAHPVIYGCLERAVEVNRLGNVTAIQAAVTGEPGPVTITDEVGFDAAQGPDSSDEAGGAGWYANTIVGSAGNGAIEVEGRTLDQIASDEGVGEIGLLKMNIEGAERPALPGMEGAIDRCRAVAISCHDFLADDTGVTAYRTKDEVRDFVRRHGLRIETRESSADPSVRDIVYGVPES